MKTKNTLLLVFAILASMFIVSCTSLVPLSDNGYMPGDAATFVVLGRVEMSDKATKTGYTKLYEKAKELYPDADDVVNIKIDYTQKRFLGFIVKRRYEFSGIAIKYNK